MLLWYMDGSFQNSLLIWKPGRGSKGGGGTAVPGTDRISGLWFSIYVQHCGYRIFSTFQGKQWQKDHLTGKANVRDAQGMKDCMEYIQKWKDLGMFTTNKKNPQSDDETRNEFMEGNTLFLLGSKNGIGETDDTKDRFGLMPYLSEDGSQNVYILNVTRYHGLSKKLEENPQKLEDALKVMEILSSVEGTNCGI